MTKYALALTLLLAPTLALAKPWNGITPNESSATDVTRRFGEPSKRLAQGDKQVLAYTAEQAISGTSQTQFIVQANGKVEQIVVFPKRALDVSEIEESYGKACSAVEKTGGPLAACYTKQLNDDFRTFFWYKRLGLVVFFGEDNKTVHSIIFNAPASSAAHPAGK